MKQAPTKGACQGSRDALIGHRQTLRTRSRSKGQADSTNLGWEGWVPKILT